jgi:branched-chain amino acid transport system substrate-binding protein
MKSWRGPAVNASKVRHRTATVVVAASLLLAAACSDDGADVEGGSPTVATDATGSTAGTPDTAGTSGGDALLGPIDAASGDPITIGFIGDGQSAAGDNEVEFRLAEATVAFLNERRAGIGGRPIELVECRTQNDPARGADCGNQMVEEGAVLVVVGATGVYQNLWEPLHAAGIPTFFYAVSGEQILADTETTFALATPSISNAAFPIGVATAADVDKVTVIAIDAPPAYEGYEGPLGEEFDRAGIDVEVVRVPIGTADMTPQLAPVIAGDPGLFHLVGNDTFCIAALQAMEALGYEGPVTWISFCLSDATRQAFPNGELEGVNVVLTSPTGDSDASALFREVVEQYGSGDIDISQVGAVNIFITFSAVDVATSGLEGEATPASLIAAMRSMEQTELPGGGGLQFQCDGQQIESEPVSCTADGLYTVLDAAGQPTEVLPTSSD